MDCKLTYDEGIVHMKELCDKRGKGCYVPEPRVCPELEIHYPGYKNHGDYRLEISFLKEPPCHTYVCELLYNIVNINKSLYWELIELLEDIYENGTNIDISKYSYYETEKIVALIFWITLQDEINYPQPKYQGRKMPFCRYFEAVYCTKHGVFDFEDVLDRCNNRGYRPKLYRIVPKPSFYS